MLFRSGVDINIDRLSFKYIRWIENNDIDVESLNITSDTKKVTDFKDRDLLIFQNDWGITWATEHNKGLVLSDIGNNNQ